MLSDVRISYRFALSDVPVNLLQSNSVGECLSDLQLF